MAGSEAAALGVVRRKLIRAVADRPELDDGYHGRVTFDVYEDSVKVSLQPKPVEVALPARLS